MKRVLLLWIGAFILTLQGIAQIQEKSPYNRTDSQSLREEWQEEKVQQMKTVVRAETFERPDHLRTIESLNDEFVNIPDTAFLYALIDIGVDTNGDSLISFSEVESVVSLWVWNRGIKDMTGIEAFVTLDTLVCDNNNIKTLNLSKLSELELLSCGSNPIDSLDLSNNPGLMYLYIVGDSLTYLKLSNNPALRELRVTGCNLSTLDVSTSVNLEELYCNKNNLVSLDLSANVKLDYLHCNENPLESLDISNNLMLRVLLCQDSTKFSTLDVSNNKFLEELYCGNSLTSLILPDTSALRWVFCFSNFLENIDVSGCPYLERFVCFNNNITSLDLTNNPLLWELSCERNQLIELDVSNNPELNALWCGENLLATLDLSNNSKIGSFPYQFDHLNVENMPSLGEVCVWESFPGDATIGYDGSPNLCFEKGEACDGACQDDFVFIPDTAFLYALIDEGLDTNGDSLISFSEADTLTELYVWTRGITDMTGIEAFVMLEVLGCDENKISTLNLSTLSELEFLSCSNNPIDSLDLSNNPELAYIWTDGCNLTTLDLSNNPSLKTLWCFANKLTALDVSANVNLRDLQCFQNTLESLDVSKNLRLKKLICHSNSLGTLDVSKNDSFEILHCAGTSLTTLILPDTSALKSLSCQVNLLGSVDVSGCPYLDYFVCFENNITSLDLTNNPLLNWLSCGQNQLTELDVSNNLELNILWCDENLLTTLDLSQNRKIGSIPEEWDHLNVENMPTLGEVCVWDSFPGDATISYDGSPNICFEKGEACDGECISGIQGIDPTELLIYPNPTSNILTIETSDFGPQSIELHTLNGQEIYTATFTGNHHQIDLSFCKRGVYILHIRSDNLTATRKVVKL